MDYSRFYLTKKGRDLLAYCQTGVPLVFSKIVIGDGLGSNITTREHIHEMTNIVSPIQECPIREIKTNNDGSATISTIISNRDTEKAFFIKEIGIFAEDPRYGEVLYAVCINNEFPDYLPPKGQEHFDLMLDVVVVIGNATNLEINIDRDLVYVTWKDFWDLAGEGRTAQTVKNNWDLIKNLELEVLKLAASGVTDIRNNQFKVSFDVLDESEDYVGIYDSKNKRLVI